MTGAENPEKGTILLVDDEQAVRSIVLRILKRANYRVLEADSGEAALKIAETHEGPIDLVITDMFMPGLRGPEVVRGVRCLSGIRQLTGTASSTGRNSCVSPKHDGPNTASAAGVRMISGVEMPTTTTRCP